MFHGNSSFYGATDVPLGWTVPVVQDTNKNKQCRKEWTNDTQYNYLNLSHHPRNHIWGIYAQLTCTCVLKSKYWSGGGGWWRQIIHHSSYWMRCGCTRYKTNQSVFPRWTLRSYWDCRCRCWSSLWTYHVSGCTNGGRERIPSMKL